MPPVTDDHHLMHCHVEALFTHNAASDLLCVNEPNGARAPRFFLGRTPGGPVLRFRDDLDDRIREELRAAAVSDVASDAMRDTEEAAHVAESSSLRYANILTRIAPVEKIWAGPAFCAPPFVRPSEDDAIQVTRSNVDVLRPYFDGWIADVSHCQPMFVVIVDDQAVSLCCSVRRTSMADEAGVETVGAYRGRAYATRVVAAWAGEVRRAGRLPLYSTSWANDASRSVARTLGLTLFGYDLHIT